MSKIYYISILLILQLIVVTNCFSDDIRINADCNALSVPKDNKIVSACVVGNNYWLCVKNNNNYLLEIWTINNGDKLISIKINTNYSKMIFKGDNVYILSKKIVNKDKKNENGNEIGNMLCYNVESFKLVQYIDSGDKVRDFYFNRKYLYIINYDNWCDIYDTDTLKKIYSIKLNMPYSIIFGNETNEFIVCTDRKSSLIYKFSDNLKADAIKKNFTAPYIIEAGYATKDKIIINNLDSKKIDIYDLNLDYKFNIKFNMVKGLYCSRDDNILIINSLYLGKGINVYSIKEQKIIQTIFLGDNIFNFLENEKSFHFNILNRDLNQLIDFNLVKEAT